MLITDNLDREFLPVFSLDDFRLLKRLDSLEGNYGILAPISCYPKLLHRIRDRGKPFFIDSNIFKNYEYPWYQQLQCEFKQGRWIREYRLADENLLRQKVRDYLAKCDQFSPDYVFALDILGEPLLSLYLARLSWEEYWQKSRTYSLIGVVQVGYSLYNWAKPLIPQLDSLPPHYNFPKSFLGTLISEYRNIGYQHIALGGLLKLEKTISTGLKFGLLPHELDELLSWSRPNFVLGGLALSRVEVLRKHRVWADSTGWLWWDARYEPERFSQRNALQEVSALT